jgi:general secretion pathway protein E
MHHPFIDHLSQEGLLDSTSLAQTQALLAAKPESPVSVLMRSGMLPEAALLESLSRFTGWPLTSAAALGLRQRYVLDGFSSLGVQSAWCRSQGVALWLDAAQEGGGIACVTSNFLGSAAQELLRIKAKALGKPVRVMLARPADIEALLEQPEHEAGATQLGGDLAALRELAEEGPIVELVNSILSQAVTNRASDIHIEPSDRQFAVRVRVDGVMRDLQNSPADRFDATVCRIKILSQLDIAERRLPQDGRMTARIHGESFDVRVSILPGARGESVVLRLLRQDRPSYALADLGMLSDHTQQFEGWVAAPNGIVLVTGPTGSGKTTTLYTALDLGNDGLKKIITVEDPVEYKLQGIVQCQVNADIGYTFANALRSILRHDPDVILIGEIRDAETAGIAVQSALTGHLVFSTLHTNSAAGAVTRLSDMGIDRFLLASSLRGIMAQRLVRRLCPHCKLPALQLDAKEMALLEAMVPAKALELGRAQGTKLYQPVGCDACMHSGYLGRLAVYELFDVDEEMRTQILNKTAETEVVANLRNRGVRSMAADGMLKVLSGDTTVAEVMTIADGA